MPALYDKKRKFWSLGGMWAGDQFRLPGCLCQFERGVWPHKFKTVLTKRHSPLSLGKEDRKEEEKERNDNSDL